MTPSIAFDLPLEHGRCVAVHLPDAARDIESLAEAALFAEERELAAAMTPIRRKTWVGGRVAMHEALSRAGLEPRPILVDDRGAPVLPEGVVGSISHKETLAVALVARKGTQKEPDMPFDGPAFRIGVDIEIDRVRPRGIASRVLADDELRELAGWDAAELEREVLLRFSAKEAIYKALDPFVRRYVAFQEVSVTPRANGTADVRARLGIDSEPFSIEVCWMRRDQGNVVLTTARVRAR